VKTAAFRLSVLGPLKVEIGGAPAALPKSRKTRALLAYLALAGGPVRRERLCELLWDAPDDPRGALRWSLSKLRPIVNAADAERLTSTAEAVAWAGAPEEVDLHAVEAALEGGVDALAPEALAALAASFRGDLLDGLALPEHVRALAARRAGARPPAARGHPARARRAARRLARRGAAPRRRLGRDRAL
jgi:DNA-binding SARP family transcriptional activator